MNYKPGELARVFARLSKTADASVMHEKEFSGQFSIEQQVKGAKEAFIAGYEYSLKPVTSMYSYNQMLEQAECYSEQLRKGGES